MSAQINNHMGLSQWLTLILLATLWGFSFFFIGIAVKELSPLIIVTLRVVLAAMVLWVVLLVMGCKISRSFEVWFAFALMGLLNNVVPFLLIVWGQTHIASGLASILNATTPMFTIVIAAIFLVDESMTKNKVIGVIIGFIGVVVLIGPFSLEDLGTNILAQLAILGSSMSYAVITVYSRRFKRMDINPMVVATGQLTASSVLLLPIAFFVEQSEVLTLVSLNVWLSVICLAVFSTAMAYILYFRLISSSGATNTSLVTFLVPIPAILLGFFVLNEQLRLEHFLGMVFISTGLLIIDGRLLRIRSLVKK